LDNIKQKIQIIDPVNIKREVNLIGADLVTIPIFEAKSQIIPIKIYDVIPAAANILKQEMLSLGGDAIVHKYTINCKIDKTDVLLLGTLKHYKQLKIKLSYMPYWGLKEIGEELVKILESFQQKPSPIQIPHGQLTFDKPLIMGIINVTPDSFFNKSRKTKLDEIVKTAQKMIEEGADILDIGGESTRPGSDPVPLEEELNRVIPAIKIIRKEVSDKIPISIDTYKSVVADKALEAGADIINDISGLRFDSEMSHVASHWNVPVVIMHIKGTPKDMQKNPNYNNFLKELHEYFVERISYAISHGINENNIILDPGIGFGKRLQDNVDIFNYLTSLQMYNKPILIGASRKSMIGMILNEKDPENRLEGTLALTAIAVEKGAHIIRVHDVKKNRKVADLVHFLKTHR